jgi:hypothetical protein
MIRDYSKTQVMWTKHASAEVLEDNFTADEIEDGLRQVAEFPEFNGNKKRGVLKIGPRYCTIIYVRTRQGIVVITCWESNPTDIKEYDAAMACH